MSLIAIMSFIIILYIKIQKFRMIRFLLQDMNLHQKDETWFKEARFHVVTEERA